MLAVDNLNGIELCERTILVDHVKQYKIPKEYMFISSAEESEGDSGESAQRKREVKAREKFEQKLYKPTGPDGKGWGEFREVSREEGIVIDELNRMETRN